MDISAIICKRKDRWETQIESLAEGKERENLQARIEELIFMSSLLQEDDRFFRHIEEEIKSYSWIQLEIKRVQGNMKIYGISTTAKWGTEASLPHATSISDPTFIETRQRIKQFHYLEDLKHRLEKIDRAGQTLKDMKQRIIFENMIDGVTSREMMRNLNMGKTTIFELKKEMIKHISAFYRFEKHDSL